MKKQLMTFLLCGSLFATAQQPVDYVNPFIGTSNYGTTNPGAACPQGMMSVVPFNVMGSEKNRFDKDSQWWSTPYSADNKFFTGFAHGSLSGVGCPELGGLLLMPTTGELNVDYKAYGSEYKDEVAHPGYYSNTLTKYNIKAEATASMRTGLSRFTFPKGESHILLNLGEGLTNETGATVRIVNDTEIEAMGATEEIVENLYREYAMADKVYQLIIQDINPEISDDEARKITVQQIFFATASTDMDGNLKPYSESSIQSAYEKACEVRDLAVDGEHDFTELASKYSDDSEITYSFGKGEAESAYEEAAFNLATDEVSQVVKCERGYYIIKCINTLDREETDANKLKIVEERKREVFGQEYDSFVNTLVRQLNDKLWDEITLIMDEQVTTDNFFDVYAKYFPEE